MRPCQTFICLGEHRKNTAIEQIELYLKHLYGYDPVKRTLHLKLADICYNYLNI